MKGVSAIIQLGDLELGCVTEHLVKRTETMDSPVFSDQLNGHLVCPFRKILLFDFIIRSTKCLSLVISAVITEYNLEGK